MRGEQIPIGILFSRSGSYSTIGEAMYAGALLAIEEVNASPEFDFVLAPRSIDPHGDIARYVEAARSMLDDGAVKHIIGCYTSSSRKEVLPIFEKRDALLWYPSHYEGFETSDNVIYTGAAPNQHVIPLTRYLLENGRRRAFFIGSNYIWAWENNRIMREALLSSGGAVCGERYFAVGETDLAAVCRQILDCRPSYVFSTLIGESAYAFYRGFRAAAEACGIDQPHDIPIVGCSLAEPELVRIGDAADGHLSSSVYFSTVATPENQRFVRAWRQRFPDLGLTSADAEASYVAVHLLARALARAGSASLDRVRCAAAGLGFAAPQGMVTIDPENRHCRMRPRIGRSTAEGTFEIIYESPAPMRPDPYLVWEADAEAFVGSTATPRLKVVR